MDDVTPVQAVITGLTELMKKIKKKEMGRSCDGVCLMQMRAAVRKMSIIQFIFHDFSAVG